MSKNFKPLHELIADKLIAQLKEGTSPFQKPWNDSDSPAFTIPINPTTGKNYRGMNSLWLSMQGHNDPRWMTLKQADFAGYKVEKGAKATLINFVKTQDIQAVRDGISGEKMKDEQGKTITRTIELDKSVITNAWVFNAEQISGITPLAEYLQKNASEQKWEPIDRAEKMLTDSRAVIEHGGNEAYYNKTQDKIRLPLKEQFDNETKYYAAALHEIGHWTGHSDRLNRPMEGRFGSEAYAREELRAEIASLMLGSEIKIGHNFGQHAAYVNNWIKILKDEPFELFRASADAQKIFDFMMNIGQKREQKKEINNAPLLTLQKDDVIPYNENTYTVMEVFKNKNVKLEDGAGARISVKPNDGLYKSLVEARNNPVEPELELEESVNKKIGR